MRNREKSSIWYMGQEFFFCPSFFAQRIVPSGYLRSLNFRRDFVRILDPEDRSKRRDNFPKKRGQCNFPSAI
jgi:hypothetical protein